MIEVAGLTKQFGRTRAVDDLSFTVSPGAVTGFLGPNGAGKTTTMRMIVGLDRPTAGSALIKGRAYKDLKNPLREVGTLLDARSVHPKRTARNHLRWVAATNGIPATRVDEVLGLVGLADVANKPAGGFSLGMGQRLGIAQALLGDPHTLILDEPVNGLDPEGIHWVRTLLQRLAREGRSVLVSSHLLSEMAQTADRLVVIGQGRLVADATTEDFIRASSRSAVVVRSPRIAELADVFARAGIQISQATDGSGRPQLIAADVETDAVGDLAFRAGIPLSELSERHGSLEEAFMHITENSVQFASNRPAGENATALPGGPGRPAPRVPQEPQDQTRAKHRKDQR